MMKEFIINCSSKAMAIGLLLNDIHELRTTNLKFKVDYPDIKIILYDFNIILIYTTDKIKETESSAKIIKHSYNIMNIIKDELKQKIG